MKVRQVFEHQCEGCGHIEIRDFQMNFMRPHHSFGKYRANEAECIEARNIRDQEEQERKADRKQKKAALLKACAESEKLRKLCQVFPDEDGEGDDWGVFQDVVESIGFSIGIYDIGGDLALGSSRFYHDLLAECIKVARKGVSA